MNRYLRILPIVFLCLVFCGSSSQADNTGEIIQAKPTAKQTAFADWEIGAFIHYGLNVYTGQEHGDGKEPPSKFNPAELDAEKWGLTAKALGAKYACLTARHEGGFCLCPTNSGFAHGGWFWHPKEIDPTYPKEHWEHIELYYRTVRLGANISINLPPDQHGLIPHDFAAAAKAFGDEIRNRFVNPVAVLKTPSPGDVVQLTWDTPQEINTIVTMENIANGQKIARYTFKAFINGDWVALAPAHRFNVKKPYNANPGFETIGHKKIDRVKPVTTNRIRFRCLKSVLDPVELRSLSVYHCETVKKGFTVDST